MLFFLLLGPLINLIVIPIDGIAYSANLHFIGFKSLIFWVQLYQYLCFVCYVGLYFIYDGKLLDPSGIALVIVLAFFRCLVISFRYATVSPTLILRSHQENWSEAQYFSDLLISGWIKGSPIQIEE